MWQHAMTESNRARYNNPYPIRLKKLSGAARFMQEVGLHTGKRKLGFMASERREGHAFTNRQSNLLQNRAGRFKPVVKLS